MDVSELRPLLPNVINPGTQADETLAGASAASADFESFLTLLTAQLRNQDPMSPMESTEFIAQLASFSSVEQQIGTNSRLDQIVGQAVNGDIASFATWIGKDVTTVDGVFRTIGEEVSFKIPEVASAETATAVIRFADGREVRRLPVGADSSDTFTWDGETSEGILLDGQDMKIEIEYFNGGTLSQTRPAIVGTTVTGIRGTENGIELDLADGRRVDAATVASVALPVS